MADPIVALTRRLKKAKEDKQDLEAVLYNFIKEIDPSWMTKRFVESTLPTLVELGEFLSENLGLQVEPGLRRRQVGSAWATNIVNALQTFFKARDASAPPKPCSWCKSYCITACEACGLSNAHLICAMHAHVFIAELKKRLCRICAQAGVRAAIVSMSVKEKKNVLAEMGVSFTNLQDANKVLLESSDFSEDQNPQDGQGASNEAGQVDSSDEDNNGFWCRVNQLTMMDSSFTSSCTSGIFPTSFISKDKT
ncbi:hypothetical protein AB1Y20_010676 [Prymnesium parvum]|uniref:Uncharacterized protein n=1 Tax=Prymnesium parvum TaxID=97485 RepID=A0AB34IPZ8_PRYPA